MDKSQRYGKGPFFNHLCQVLDLSCLPELVRYNTNLIYDGGDFFIRLTPNDFRSRDEVMRELHWLQFVGIQSQDVVQVRGDTTQIEFNGKEFTVTTFERIEGEPISVDQWCPSHFRQLGSLTAFLHRVSQNYAPSDEFDLYDWDRIPEALLAHSLPADERTLPELNNRVLEHVTAIPRHSKTFGPIHNDIHSGNYLMTPDGRLVLLDFENACRGHYINDIAVVLYYAITHRFSEDDLGFTSSFLDSFWKGYETEYSVPENELDHIPWFLLNRALVVYGYMLKIWPGEREEQQQFCIDRVERSIVSLRKELGL